MHSGSALSRCNVRQGVRRPLTQWDYMLRPSHFDPKTVCCGSSKVDVPPEAGFIGPFKQEEQRRPLGCASPAPDDDDDPVMGLSLRQFDEVVTIAGHHQAIVIVRELQDERIGRFPRKHIAQPQDFVTELSKQVDEILGDVVVEQKSHR
jgi:hypothetical protein